MHALAFVPTLNSVCSMPAAFTRRQWLRLSAGPLIPLGVWPGRLCGADAPAHDDFTFIAVNDLHALEDACHPWFDDVVRQMKASAPTAEFCLLGGDLAENGTPAQLNLIKDSFSALGIPCHAVVGNHDYQSATDRSAYEQIFPEQINYSFTRRGWQIIVSFAFVPSLSPGSIKTCPNWTSIARPSCSLIFHWAIPSGPGLSTPTIYLSAVMG
jgi:Calcineurin-like phosphoesterase